jgi:hypothetical protein
MKPQHHLALFTFSGALLLAALAYFYFELPSTVAADVPQSLVATTSDSQASQDSFNTLSTSNAPDFSTTTYQYKVLQSVDPCTLNTLGRQGWRPVLFGTDPDTGTTLVSVSGRDEACQKQFIYQGLLWAVFEQATSSTENTITSDTASALQYKIIQTVDPCTFDTLGSQGWRATQFGTTLSSVGGYDATCKTSGIYKTVDWVMFERPIR